MIDENEVSGSESTRIGEDVAESPPSPPSGAEDEPTRLETLLIKGLGIALAVVLLLLFGLHTCVGGWPVNYGAPVRGRVIDERTGRPVTGAVVVGQWYTTAFMGAQHRMHASEAVTDGKGEFFLPGMPLKIRRPFDHYETYDPLLAVYKPGYAVIINADNVGLKRMGYQPYSMAMRRISYWDGKDLPLVPAEDIKGEAESLARIYDIAKWPYVLHPRRYPHLWSAILQGARRIPKGQFGYGRRDPTESYKYQLRNEK